MDTFLEESVGLTKPLQHTAGSLRVMALALVKPGVTQADSRHFKLTIFPCKMDSQVVLYGVG